jgi:AraC-like DNA-binding protein
VSKTRQVAIFDRLASSTAPVVTLAQDYAAGHVIPMHFHDRDQLVFASRGVMTVRTDRGAWVVPTHRAVWIPCRIAHTIAISGAVAMRTLYLKPRLATALPRSCRVVQVSALLRELVLHACACGKLSFRVSWHRHLVDVILDQLRAIEAVPLQLPLPTDPRALRVAESLQADPSGARTLDQICRASGASRRTIERMYVEETGMTAGKWRQQLRLLHALRLLGQGVNVTGAALDSGYSTSSAFIASFRKALGTTPARYFQDIGEISTAGHGLRVRKATP